MSSQRAITNCRHRCMHAVVCTCIVVVLLVKGVACFVPSATCSSRPTTLSLSYYITRPTTTQTTTRNAHNLEQLETTATTETSSSLTTTSTETPTLLQQVPDASLDDNTQQDDDDFFRNIRDTWPLWMQHGLRDSGGLRLIVDFLTRTVAASAFYKEHPHCLPEFLRISGYPSWLVLVLASGVDVTTSNSSRVAGAVATDYSPAAAIDFSIESYGPHPSQYAEVMTPSSSTSNRDGSTLPLFCFVHGGAWGSGFPTMYRLLSVPFLERGYRVAILGYRTYPDATVDGQVDDVALALNHLTRKEGKRQAAILMGHSSGAHISLMAALRQQLPPSVTGLICMSGVYDVEAHFEFETTRGVDEISPMSPACGGSLDNWRVRSPTRLVATVKQAAIDALPQLLFLHGELDTTVPMASTTECHEAFAARLGKQQSSPKVQILKNVDHSETVLQTLFGGQTQDAVFEWIDSLKKS